MDTTRNTIRVLGPIDVATPAGPAPVGGPRSRALLGALVISAGHAVPIDHLCEVMWGDEQPRSAHNTLQSHVSQLRHLLGYEAIVLTDHSYELDADTVGIDARDFERLLWIATDTRDDAEERWRLSREALDLWRGRPFGDLADSDPFRLEAYRLDELRLTAMELNMSADLELGRHELVVGELESAVEEHPYREPLWYLLIDALARGGRRVEALRTCARLRHVLREVGVSPGAELDLHERRILEGDIAAR